MAVAVTGYVQAHHERSESERCGEPAQARIAERDHVVGHAGHQGEREHRSEAGHDERGDHRQTHGGTAPDVFHPLPELQQERLLFNRVRRPQPHRGHQCQAHGEADNGHRERRAWPPKPQGEPGHRRTKRPSSGERQRHEAHRQQKIFRGNQLRGHGLGGRPLEPRRYSHHHLETENQPRGEEVGGEQHQERR